MADFHDCVSDRRLNSTSSGRPSNIILKLWNFLSQFGIFNIEKRQKTPKYIFKRNFRRIFKVNVLKSGNFRMFNLLLLAGRSHSLTTDPNLDVISCNNVDSNLPELTLSIKKEYLDTNLNWLATQAGLPFVAHNQRWTMSCKVQPLFSSPKNERRETFESSHHQKMDFLTGRLFQKMSLMLT